MTEILIPPETKLTKEEVLQSSMQYFGGDELAATTWMNKYCLKDEEGNFRERTPDNMHKRMAGEFFRIENEFAIKELQKGNLSKYGQTRDVLSEEVIYRLFKDFKYLIPQGSVMSQLGDKKTLGSLSNCVVIKSPEDSYGGIFLTDQQIAQLCKRRCGVGFDISSLRPKGAQVKNAAGSSSGVVSFMDRFSNTTREVSQHGRRGALMLTMDIRHPDIVEFIQAKKDLTKVTGANISVLVSDQFMKAVEQNEAFDLRWPVDSAEPQIVKSINASELWGELTAAAHQSAEPGIIFWDRQHYYSTSSIYPQFKNDSTNPCSEIAMQGGDSCRLMALNLFSFVDHPFTSEARFDYDKFYQVTYEAQRLMDDLVTLELEAVDRILNKIESDPESDVIKDIELSTWRMLRENGEKGRRTGLGFTALADTLAALGVKFDSNEAIDEVEQIMKSKCRAEFDSSIDMAIERGKFEAYDSKVEEESTFVDFFKEEFPESYERMKQFGRRNVSISTVAPTGSVSMLAQTSSGIEPVFLLSYTRRRKLGTKEVEKSSFVDDLGDHWEEFEVYHHKLKDWMKMYPEKKVTESPYAGATANEINWRKRIDLQATIQKYVTHSISSTINLPESATHAQVKEIYTEAWRRGLKGITVYRDGSRAGVLVKSEEKTKQASIIDRSAPERPKELFAKIVKFRNSEEYWLAFVGLLNDRPYEVFTGRAEDAFALPNYVDSGWIKKSIDDMGKSRYDFRYIDSQGYNVLIEGLSRSFSQEYWNYAKLISGILRHGMPLLEVLHLIENLNLDNSHINTWKNGVTRALRQFIPAGTQSKDHFCTECGDSEGLIYEEGCLKCKSCGHTKCG